MHKRQKEIARQIRKKRSDYVLALKKNQGTLHEDVELVDVGIAKISVKNKRLMLCMNFSRYLDAIMAL